VNLLQLRYFRRIANVQSVTQVAEEFHISQPAISKIIKNLETELGVKLFDRDGKFIKLNEKGRIFLRYVDKVFQALDEAKKELNDNSPNSIGIITIYDQTCSTIVPQIIKEFNIGYPNIRFNIYRKQFRNIVQRDDDYDIMIFDSTQNEPSSPSSITLITEDLMIAVSKNHFLANRESITLAEVANEKFISLPQNATLRKTTEHYCKMAGFEMNTVAECFEWMALRELVRLGVGIAFFPKHSWSSANETEVAFINISSPKCTRSITMSLNDAGYLSRPLRTFKDFMIEYYRRFA
jgi:LysR family transcriptional activator of glutamate synthase operon